MTPWIALLCAALAQQPEASLPPASGAEPSAPSDAAAPTPGSEAKVFPEALPAASAEGSAPAEAASPPAESAPESVEFNASAPAKFQVTTTGYVDTRFPVAHLRSEPLAPANAPAISNLTEGNLQIKVAPFPLAFFSTDTSLFWQWASFYKDGQPYDVSTYRPQLVVSELYGSVEAHPHLHLTLGKKRVVWGPGMAQNPTDFLNPPKDPTNPTAQRVGAWLGRIELPFDNFTFSLVGAGKVLRQYAGLPTALVYYPSYPTAEAVAGTAADDRDHEPHFALAARAYALIANTDVNLVYGFTNFYNDAFRRKHRGGFTLSRVFGAWEFHTEALMQTGYSRLWPNSGCAESPEAMSACLGGGTPVASRSRLNEATFTPKVLLGTRYQFEDNSLLSAEYYFNGEGLNAQGFSDYVNLLADGRPLALANPQYAAVLLNTLAGGAGDPGSPQRFQFDPLRRHYLFLSYSKSQLWNDFTLGASVVLSLSDLSGQVAPFVTWAPLEWLNVNATAYLGIPSPRGLGVQVNGVTYGEMSLSASDFSVQTSARVFF